ncbi:MAG: DUF4357 domain-containing protein [Candidatus Accumulibacter sp.]|jgi:hypothetical protein|nr:DUF4357 domain-containing protein [Accumulibacter sp.]
MIVMGTFGHKVFEPLLQIAAPTSPTENANAHDEQMFFIKRNNANAKGKLTNEGIVVLADSVIRKDIVPGCHKYAKTIRDENRDGNSILLKDILFKTPSGASCFVLGAPTNGNIEWKTEDGKTLKEVEDEPFDVP